MGQAKAYIYIPRGSNWSIERWDQTNSRQRPSRANIKFFLCLVFRMFPNRREHPGFGWPHLQVFVLTLVQPLTDVYTACHFLWLVFHVPSNSDFLESSCSLHFTPSASLFLRSSGLLTGAPQLCHRLSGFSFVFLGDISTMP